jgi:hypothetical protein
MTDTTPAPTGTPAKKSPWRIIGPVIGVLIVLGGIVYQVVLPAIADSKYKVGACLDFIPTSTVSTSLTEDPKVVDCNDSAAQSKIIAAIEGKTLSDAKTACPTEWVAAISFDAQSFFSKDKLLCLVEA